MTNDDLLVMLKSNLEIITEYMDAEAKAAKNAELITYIEAAKKFIIREGVNSLSLDEIDDCMLIVMYAAWLYEKRKVNVSYGNSVEMPRMLRWNINNRLIREQQS